MNKTPTTAGFAFNLTVLIAMGVCTLYWVGYHTEFLGIIGGLLGLGGVFAWVAFIGKLITDNRKTLLQNAFDALLSRPRTTVYLLFLSALLAVAAGNFGSVQIDARKDTLDRFVTIFDRSATMEFNDGKDDVQHEYRAEVTKAGSVRNYLLFTGLDERNYEIRIDGLPVLQQTVKGISRVKLQTPDSFLQKNIILIRPDSELTQTLKNANHEITMMISIGDGNLRRKYKISNYRGASVWIGCDESVAIPEPLKESWRLELLAQGVPQAVILSWLSPLSRGEDATLLRGEPMEITLEFADNVHLLTERSIVENCGSASCFPQEIVLTPPTLPQEETE